MKLNPMKAGRGDPAEEQYMIEDVSVGDVAPATKHLREFVQELKGYPFINYFTLDELTEQAKKRFTHPKT